MSFSHLLAKAPYYSPARFQRPKRPAPSEVARRAYAPAPLVNPFETLSAPQFDSFVDDVSSRITEALSYDRERDGKRRRGYPDDEEYWLEMGGKPGEFLGQKTSSHAEEQVEQDASAEEQGPLSTEDPEHVAGVEDADDDSQASDDASSSEDVTDEAVPATAVSITHQPDLYPDLNGLQDESLDIEQQQAQRVQQDIYPSLAPLQERQLGFVPASKLLSDGAYLEDQLPATPSADLTFPADVTYDLGVLPELNGEGDDSLPIDTLLGMAKQDAERLGEAIAEVEDLEAEEAELDRQLLEEMQVDYETETAVQQPDAPPSRQPRLPKSSNESAGADVEAQDQDLAVEDLFEQEDEDDELRDEQVPRSASKQDSDVISIGSSSDTEDATPPPPSVQPAAHQQSRKTLPPSISQPPPPSQARLMSHRVFRQLEDDDKEASGYESDEDEPEDDQDVFGRIEDDQAAGEGPEEEEEDPDTAEFKRMSRKASKRRAVEMEQDAEDAYFDGEDEVEDEEDEDREAAASEEDESEDSSSSRSQASHNAQRHRHRATATQDEFVDELSDAELAEDDARARQQEGELDERVPIPAFMKKNQVTGEYDLNYSGEEEEDSESEDGSEMSGDEGSLVADQMEEAVGEDDAAIDGTRMQEEDDSQDEDSIPVLQDNVEPTLEAEADETQELEAILQEAEALADSLPLPDSIDMPTSDEIVNAQSTVADTQSFQPILDLLSETITGSSNAALDPLTPSAFAFDLIPELPSVSMEDSAGQKDPHGTGVNEMEPQLTTSAQPTAAETYTEHITMRIDPEEVQDSTIDVAASTMDIETVPNSRLAAEVSAGADSADAPLIGRQVDGVLPNGQDDQAQVAKSPSFSEARLPPFLPASLVIPPQPSPGLAMSAIDPLPTAFPFRQAEAAASEPVIIEQTLQAIEEVRPEGSPSEGPSATQDPAEEDAGLIGQEVVVEAATSDVSEDKEPPAPEEDTVAAEMEMVADCANYSGASASAQANDVASPLEEESIAVTEPVTPLVDLPPRTDMLEQSEPKQEPEPVEDAALMAEHITTEPLMHHDAELNLAVDANPALNIPLETPDGDASFDIGSLIAPTRGVDDAALAPIDEDEIEADMAPITGQQTEDTPTRTINALAPGLWNPDTPIRFGGRSLEAAVREAAHDETRRQTLREKLGMEKDELQKKQEAINADFVPLETDETQDESNDALQLVKESKGEDVADHISSPGPSGIAELSEAVKEDDYVDDAVAEAVNEESTLHAPSIIDNQNNTSPEVGVSNTDIIPPVGAEDAQQSTSRLSESPVIVEYTDAVPEYQSMADASTDDEDAIAQSLLSPKPKSEPAKQRRKRSETPEVYGSSALEQMQSRGRPRTRGAAGQKEEVRPASADQSSDENVVEVVASPAISHRALKGKDVDRTPEKPPSGASKHKKRTSISKTTVIVADRKDERASSPADEIEVAALLTPSTSKPRYHRHGEKKEKNKRSSSVRRSNEPVLGTSAAPVHPEMDKHHSQHGFGRLNDTNSSPITTRSHCTYHKLSIPNPFARASSVAEANTPLRRMSTRLARATDPTTPQYAETYIFLVPGCTVYDRTEQMKAEGMIDLGNASNQEEGSAIQLIASEDGDQISVEGLPDAVLQSLIRVVGLEMFREGDCEILAPILSRQEGSGTVSGSSTERKRKRESDIGLAATPNKRVAKP